jgi:hypothetical protein
MTRYAAGPLDQEAGPETAGQWTVHDLHARRPVIETLHCTKAQAFLIASMMNLADVNARAAMAEFYWPGRVAADAS